MFDHGPIRLERATGEAFVALDAASRLLRLRQAGSAKAFLPRTDRAEPEVVFLNTSGGLAGGDRLALALDLAAGARATGTTQTAERAYRSADGTPAEVTVSLAAGAGARLDWLPQETILYDGAAVTRRTRADLKGDAALILAECIVLGRVAMGEAVRHLGFFDRREVWREGRPVWIDAVRLDGQALAPTPALLAGARAFATVAMIAPGAEDALGAVRGALPAGAVTSAWDGKLVVRMAGPDAFALRRSVAAVIHILRRGAPLPRVWQI